MIKDEVKQLIAQRKHHTKKENAIWLLNCLWAIPFFLSVIIFSEVWFFLNPSNPENPEKKD